MQRWLIEYENTADPNYLLDTVTAGEIRIVGVYPDAFCFIVEAPEKILMKWIATLAVKRIVTGPFSEKDVQNEVNPNLKELMHQWNQYSSNLVHGTRPHEGLTWDHPGFLPPDKPDRTPDN